MGVECRPIRGVSDEQLRIGWAKQDKVKAVDVPGFMVWPETKASAQGYAKAKPDEKIIYYLVGGGFISGHPLRTHLAWWTSEQLQVRLFGEYPKRAIVVLFVFSPFFSFGSSQERADGEVEVR